MIGICITAKNEENTIGGIVSYFRLVTSYPVYVADNGSSDRTGDEARKAGAIVIRRDPTWDIAPSLMDLWRRALADGCEQIVQLDAGGSHIPQQSEDLLLRAREFDVVIGSRFIREGSVYVGNPRRQLLSQLATAMCNLAQNGANHTDWTSGYRVFSARAAEELLKRKYHAGMHGWQIETLAWAGYLGMSIAEVPITYIAGRSSFNVKVAHEAFLVWLHIFNHLGIRRQPK